MVEGFVLGLLGGVGAKVLLGDEVELDDDGEGLEGGIGVVLLDLVVEVDEVLEEAGTVEVEAEDDLLEETVLETDDLDNDKDCDELDELLELNAVELEVVVNVVLRHWMLG